MRLWNRLLVLWVASWMVAGAAPAVVPEALLCLGDEPYPLDNGFGLTSIRRGWIGADGAALLLVADGTGDGLYRAELSAPLVEIIRDGDLYTAFGAPSGSFITEISNIIRPTADTNGDVAFRAWVDLNGTIKRVTYAGSVLGPTALAQEGIALPPYGTIDSLPRPLQNRFGDLVFETNFTFDPDVLYFGPPGATVPTLIEGDPAPGFGVEAYFDRFGATGLNDVGELALSGRAHGGSANFTNALWTGPPSSLQMLVKAGDPAETVSGSAVFTDMGSYRIDTGGWGAFNGSLTGMGIDSSNDSGVWALQQGIPRLVVQKGQDMPGCPAGAGFSLDDFGVSAAGIVVFSGQIDTSHPDVTTLNNNGIWRWFNGGLQLVARQGDPAPGFPGNTFDAVSGTIAMDSRGDILFSASLELAVPGFGRRGIWMAEPGQGAEPFVVPGSTMNIDGVPTFVYDAGHFVSSLGRAGNGESSPLNRNHQLVIEVDLVSNTTCAALAQFDDLFADGFESGNTNDWSSTVP